jgi:membrane fusion protein (multidrug efflux system)
MNKNSNKTTGYILFSCLVGFFLFACGGGDSAQKGGRGDGKSNPAGKRAAKAIPVEVKKPAKAIAASYYVTTSTIEPSSDAKINSRTSGVVKKLLHEEGDDVLAGEVLLILDDDDQQLRLKQAEQKLASASREFKRLNKMKKSGMVSPTEWETTENTFKTAETEKQLAELALSYTRVAAPFGGRVVWREVDLGEHVGQGELLFRMMSIRPLLVRVHIPANRLGMVEKGQSVQLTIDGVTQSLSAKVELISPIVDPTSGTIKITLRIDNYPTSVRPGDFTEVKMVTDKHENALLVSSVAIIEERGKHFLYIVEKGKARRVPVTTGFVMSEQTEIVVGISETDSIVVKGQRTLNDDVLVEILSEPNNGQQKSNAEIKKLDINNKRGQP